jgi:hypothetical protein
MVGRSLFSLLAVAAVALQSCAAAVIPDGTYTIVNNHGYLTSPVCHPDAPVLMNQRKVGLQIWDVRNGGDTIAISNAACRLFLHPSSKGVSSVVLGNLFNWRVTRQSQGFVIERADNNPNERLVLTGSSSIVVTQVLRPGNPSQSWQFIRL